MISVIIPTLNEEKYLPQLLKTIKEQKFNDIEIIVADNNSTDKTREIAKSYGCRITSGGLPARGRNSGAKIAKGDILLFLDADVTLLPNSFRKTVLEFDRRELDVASFKIISRKGNKLIKGGFDALYNWPSVFLQDVLPHGAMGIMVKKEIFNKVGGFDEKIKLAEDHYFVRQASEIGKFGIISSVKLFVSLRRFRQDGYIRTLSKYLLTELYMLSGKPPKYDFNYKFGHYSRKKKD
jgi:glycosyltransferase involved in cell wall biosynthesis